MLHHPDMRMRGQVLGPARCALLAQGRPASRVRPEHPHDAGVVAQGERATPSCGCGRRNTTAAPRRTGHSIAPALPCAPLVGYRRISGSVIVESRTAAVRFLPHATHHGIRAAGERQINTGALSRPTARLSGIPPGPGIPCTGLGSCPGRAAPGRSRSHCRAAWPCYGACPWLKWPRHWATPARSVAERTRLTWSSASAAWNGSSTATSPARSLHALQPRTPSSTWTCPLGCSWRASSGTPSRATAPSVPTPPQAAPSGWTSSSSASYGVGTGSGDRETSRWSASSAAGQSS